MAGLGAGGSERLTGLLESLKLDIPILLIEHDMDAVFRLADRISVLVYGQIVAQGTSHKIRHDPLVREAYLGSSDLDVTGEVYD
jgi:branched-chain amino acid transport system ATP-binding protein